MACRGKLENCDMSDIRENRNGQILDYSEKKEEKSEKIYQIIMLYTNL